LQRIVAGILGAAEHARGFGNLSGNLTRYSHEHKRLRNAFQVAKFVRLPTGRPVPQFIA
jgi:hypothetical protein